MYVAYRYDAWVGEKEMRESKKKGRRVLGGLRIKKTSPRGTVALHACRGGYEN